jgi:hypothetical protein
MCMIKAARRYLFQNTPKNDATKGDTDSEVTVLRKDERLSLFKVVTLN